MSPITDGLTGVTERKKVYKIENIFRNFISRNILYNVIEEPYFLKSEPYVLKKNSTASLCDVTQSLKM